MLVFFALIMINIAKEKYYICVHVSLKCIFSALCIILLTYPPDNIYIKVCGQVDHTSNYYQKVSMVLLNILKNMYVLYYIFLASSNILLTYYPAFIYSKVCGQVDHFINFYLKVLIVSLSILKEIYLHIINYIFLIHFNYNAYIGLTYYMYRLYHKYQNVFTYHKVNIISYTPEFSIIKEFCLLLFKRGNIYYIKYKAPFILYLSENFVLENQLKQLLNFHRRENVYYINKFLINSYHVTHNKRSHSSKIQVVLQSHKLCVVSQQV